MMETRGWIEYRPYYAEKERNEDYPWLAWMSIDSVIDSVDEITETLFGYSKRIIRKEFEVHALAKNRGIPDNASDVVKWEVEKIKSFEKEYGEGEVFGYSVISFDEIKRNTLTIIEDSCWAKLFALIEEFKNIKGIDDYQIRLVVWFEWLQFCGTPQ